MPTPCQHDDDISTQRKGKESKLNRNETDNKETDNTKPDPIPYQEIVNLFNEICTEAPKIIKVTDKRKKQIALRYKELEDLTVFEQAFRMVQGIKVSYWG